MQVAGTAEMHRSFASVKITANGWNLSEQVQLLVESLDRPLRSEG